MKICSYQSRVDQKVSKSWVIFPILQSFYLVFPQFRIFYGQSYQNLDKEWKEEFPHFLHLLSLNFIRKLS